MPDRSTNSVGQGQACSSLADASASASRKIHRAGVNNALIASLQQATTWLWCVGVVYVLLRFAERVAMVPARSAAWVALAGVAFVAVRAGASVFAAWQRTPVPTDVAERLDLASNDSNLIATAVSLSAECDRSPFAALAVLQGVEALNAYRSHDPVVTVARLGVPKVVGTSLLAAIFFMAGFFVPRWNPAARLDQAGARFAQGDAIRATHNTEPVKRPTGPSFRPQAAQASPQSTASGKVSQALSPPMAAGSRSNAGRSEGAAMANGTLPTKTMPRDPLLDEVARQQAASGSRQPSTPTAAASASSSPGAGGAGGSGSWAAGDSARSSKGPPDTKGSQTTNGDAAAAEATSPDDVRIGTGEAGGRQPTKAMSSTEGPKPDKSDGRSGSGRTGGADAMKKSRGVASLMLGTPQPDLLTSRPLVGPDARSDLKVPPRPDPQTSAPAAAATPLTSEEAVTDVCRVPALSRQSVGRYFEEYHRIKTP